MEIIEEWRTVEGHNHYQVSNLGRVRSLDRWIDHRGGKREFHKGVVLKSWINDSGYNIVGLGKTEKKCRVHRLMAESFLGLTGSQDVDHVDGNRSNNSINNLRVCSTSQNLANGKKAKSNTSGFKGVTWASRGSKWKAQIGHRNTMIFLGHFETKEEASSAYDEAAVLLFGEFALTNAMLVRE